MDQKSLLTKEQLAESLEELEKFAIFPIRHHDIYELFEKAERAIWNHKEIDFSRDRADFEACKPPEQKMLKHVMGFFAGGDAIVHENLMELTQKAPFVESRLFYGLQTYIEMEHTITYALGVQACVRDIKEQNELLRSIITIPSIQRKSKWVLDQMAKAQTLEEKLLVNVITEGVFFQGAFAVIFWFKQQYPGKLHGIIQSNELIAADEALHADHGVMIYRKLKALPQKDVFELFDSAMAMEREFVSSFLDGGVLGLNVETLVAFLEHVCDYWLTQLGYEKRFNTKNPLSYMDTLSLRPRSNFFERRNREYTNSNAVSSVIQDESFVSSSILF